MLQVQVHGQVFQNVSTNRFSIEIENMFSLTVSDTIKKTLHPTK